MTDIHAVSASSDAPDSQSGAGGSQPTTRLHFRTGTLSEANALLSAEHYLGPARMAKHVFVAERSGVVVAAQCWKSPTSRRLPTDWLELCRWVLTERAGPNAGSMMSAWAARQLRALGYTTLISYSDPSVGHTGSLYRASGWYWCPTWMRLRTPPSSGGSWDGIHRQAVKDRWAIDLAPDDRRAAVLAVNDDSLVRRYGTGRLAWKDFFA